MRIRHVFQTMITAALWPLVSTSAQTSLPGGTANGSNNPSDSSPYGNATVKRDIPYVANPHVRQTFDLYLPKDKVSPVPLVFWIHGGAWMLSKKDWKNVKYLVKHGYALASVDYRL